MSFLAVAVDKRLLILLSLVLIFAVFAYLVDFFFRVFSKERTNLKPSTKLISWIASIFISFLLIGAFLYALYKLFLVSDG